MQLSRPQWHADRQLKGEGAIQTIAEHEGPILEAQSIAQCGVSSWMALRIVPFSILQAFHS